MKKNEKNGITKYLQMKKMDTSERIGSITKAMKNLDFAIKELTNALKEYRKNQEKEIQDKRMGSR